MSFLFKPMKINNINKLNVKEKIISKVRQLYEKK